MKIGICGTSCCGKTTLFNMFRNAHPEYCSIGEIASEFSEKERENFGFQYTIMKNQVIYEKDLHPTFVTDRTVLDNLAYCMWYNKFYKFNQPGIYNDVIKLFNEHMQTKPYDLIIFVDDIFKLVNNGVRKMDEAQQRDIYWMLRYMVPFYCEYYDIEYRFVSGSNVNRMKTIEDALMFAKI